MVRGGGRGAGFKVVLLVPLLSKGARGSTTGRTRGQESDHKKPTMGIVIFVA